MPEIRNFEFLVTVGKVKLEAVVEAKTFEEAIEYLKNRIKISEK